MDFVSWFLSILGLGQAHAARVSDRRVEAHRLAAEVSGEARKALDLVENETARLLTRCARLYPTDNEFASVCAGTMGKIRQDTERLIGLCDGVTKRLPGVRAGADWDRVIGDLNEWRATASRLVPWIEGVVKRIDALLDAAGMTDSDGGVHQSSTGR